MVGVSVIIALALVLLRQELRIVQDNDFEKFPVVVGGWGLGVSVIIASALGV